VKIATFNAAGIRARLPYLLNWLQSNPVDVLAIQETKVEDHIFPKSDFEALGYEAILHGQKAWNGVCFLTKLPVSNVKTGFGDPEMPEDARIIAADIAGVRVINTYVPNGNTVGAEKWTYKMQWLERFRAYLDEIPKSQQVLWLGDINIAPQPHDVFDSKKVYGGVGHHPDEFSRLSNIVSYGLIDLFRLFEFGGEHYTFWEFTIPNAVQKGVGWRIDHIYATEQLAEKCLSCVIDKPARLGEKPSDHTFVIAEFSL
jgi:exodeoxyribonuclease III